MYFPLIPANEARDLLVQEAYADEARAEMLAEDGASAFAIFGNSGDAMAVAHMVASERERDFSESEEGQRYYARLEAARLYEDLPALSEWDIPEFVDGKTSWDHNPFRAVRMIYTNDTHQSADDLPF